MWPGRRREQKVPMRGGGSHGGPQSLTARSWAWPDSAEWDSLPEVSFLSSLDPRYVNCLGRRGAEPGGLAVSRQIPIEPARWSAGPGALVCTWDEYGQDLGIKRQRETARSRGEVSATPSSSPPHPGGASQVRLRGRVQSSPKSVGSQLKCLRL